MLYAKVVVGLPVEGPFDYSVPANLVQKINIGSRVWVQFRHKRKVGYVVGLSRTTKIKQIKPILEVIDCDPLLDKGMLLLTRKISDYYCCSWGDAIEAVLPQDLRKGKTLKLNT